jgi:hypothetical protein
VTETAGETYREIEYDRMYPIYMIWPTGALESYWEDWTRVRAGRLTHWSDPSTLASTPVRPASDLLRGLASTPAAWATSAFEFSQTGFGLGSEAYTMKRDWKLHVNEGKPIDKRVEIRPDQNLYFSPWEPEEGSPPPPEGEPVADLLFQDGLTQDARVLASFAYHGATAPVRALTTLPLVGLGDAGWRNMVRRTRTSVRSATEFPDEFAREARGGEDVNNVDIASSRAVCDSRLQGDAAKLRRCYPRGSGGFARVFQWLESCMKEQEIAEGADGCPPLLSDRDRETLRNARIVMIGHSMGAIVVNELLQLFSELPYESLVYMGGAASIRETSRAVTRVLENNRGCTKFYGLMLHPMNEAREPTGFGLLPSGSLLVYVDEFLEVPKTVPDRTVGQWRNLRATRHVFFPEEARRWMLFRVFDRAQVVVPYGNGREYPNPTSHGAFNDEDVPFWQEVFWKPEDVEFPEPGADCQNLFTSRLVPPAIEVGAGVARAITIPAEEMARKWQMVWQEVDGGKTVAITSGGETIARIVPIQEDQEDAAVLGH